MYADYNDRKNQTLVHILGSLLHQFLNIAQQPILDEVAKKLRDIQRMCKNVETQDILPLLKQQLKQFKRAFICIDAVDELEPVVQQQLLRELKDLVTNDTRIFLTGRDHIQSKVEEHLRPEFVPRYITTISASQQEIQKLVEQQMQDDQYSDAMDEVLAKNIADGIIGKSKGM